MKNKLLFVFLISWSFNAMAYDIKTKTMCIGGYVHAVVVVIKDKTISVSSNQILEENDGVITFKPIKCGKKLEDKDYLDQEN